MGKANIVWYWSLNWNMLTRIREALQAAVNVKAHMLTVLWSTDPKQITQAQSIEITQLILNDLENLPSWPAIRLMRDLHPLSLVP